MENYCEIVVDACPRAELRETLEFARAMAKSFRARLTVTSYAWPKTSMKDVLLPNPLWAGEQTFQMERALAKSRSLFEELFNDERGETEWCSDIAEPTAALHVHLLTADLLITDTSEEDTIILPNPAHLALMSGVPVLRLGRQPASDRFSSILVAWKDTPQARRSLHDALPILRRADTVGVVGVGDEVSMERLDAVATHLHRHKIKAKHWHIPDTAGDVCSSLLAHAQNEGAQLIVAGVFGRGHLTERVLGGVTTNMLKNSELSWFMAH